MSFLDVLRLKDPFEGIDLDWRTEDLTSRKLWQCPAAMVGMLDDARRDVKKLEWQLARSGSDCYMYSGEEMTAIQQEMLDLRREKARLLAENDLLKEQVAYLRGHASERAYKRSIDEMHGWQQADQQRPSASYELIEVLKPVQDKQQPRQGTRFASRSGATKQEQLMACACYWENGYDIGEIAEQLQISPGSARAYLSTIKKHYRVEVTQEGRMIQFDKEYGDVRWSLAFYERTHLGRAVTGS